mmetsp:Transcript_9008/g.31813  ORF Transcript_9008/g.31813 Transcript_9008/m.31813 type:complete len:125 (-) Transcript_9008:134-508(-)
MYDFTVEVAPGEEDRSYTLYRVTVTVDVGGDGETKDGEGETMHKYWSVDRRYSEFADLHSRIEGLTSGVENEFPAKKTFGGRDPETVRERVFYLPAWLTAVSRLEAVASHEAFKAFIDLAKHED